MSASERDWLEGLRPEDRVVTEQPNVETQAKRHKHTFHALSYNFGPYGRQDVHVHPCWDEDCARVLIGEGRDCSGKQDDHHRETLR